MGDSKVFLILRPGRIFGQDLFYLSFFLFYLFIKIFFHAIAPSTLTALFQRRQIFGFHLGFRPHPYFSFDFYDEVGFVLSMKILYSCWKSWQVSTLSML